MKISIITPSYNQAEFIEQTIQSVLSQKYSNFEYIIIDGGSTDESVNIIRRYEQKLTYWVSEKDNGQSNAINKGLERATGDIITWINSDDILLPGALHQVAEHFISLPDAVGVIHGGTVLFEKGKDLREIYTYGIPSIEKYLSGMVFSQPAAFFRKCYLNEVGLLREDLHFGMDYDLFARLACVCRFQPVDNLFSKYRLHDESKSVAHSERFRDDWNRVFLSICRHLGWDTLVEEAFAYLPDLKNNQPLLDYQILPRPDILNEANQQKVLFYFLSDLLLHYYWYDNRELAKQLLQKMEPAFDKRWFNEDGRVKDVVRKLKLPDLVLRSLKTLKQYLKKA